MAPILKKLKSYLLANSSLKRSDIEHYQSVDDLFKYVVDVLDDEQINRLQHEYARLLHSGILANEDDSNEGNSAKLPRTNLLQDPDTRVGFPSLKSFIYGRSGHS